MHLGTSRLRGRHHKQLRAQTISRSTDQLSEGGNVSSAALQQETISSDRRQIYVIDSPVHLVWLSRAFVEQHSPKVTNARSTAVRMTSGVKEKAGNLRQVDVSTGVPAVRTRFKHKQKLV